MNHNAFLSGIKLDKNLYSKSALLLIILLGVIIRIKGLGIWPLAEDEFYLVKSINNLLKYGIPHWDTGGYYIRGLLNQYLTAPLFLLGLQTEFAARIIPVLFNILTIIPLYFLAKKIKNNIVAAVLIIVFSFSVWEVEMARFARMYTAFQMIFVFYVLALYEAVFNQSSKARTAMYILSTFSSFVHEAGIFLAILNFSDILWTRKIVVKNLFISTFIIIFNYGLLSFSFWNLGSMYPYPTDVTIPQSGSRSTFQFPDILIGSLSLDIWIIIFLSLSLLAVIKLYRTLKENELSVQQKSFITGIILLSILNFFGIIILFTVLFLLLSLLKRSDLSNGIIRKYFYIPGLYGLFWFVFSIADTESNSFSGLLKETFVVLFRYPDFWWWTKVYLQTIPLFTIISGVLVASNFILIVLDENTNHYKTKFIYYLLLIIVSIMASLNLTIETRYAFFFFPLILLLLVISVYNLSVAVIVKVKKINNLSIFNRPESVTLFFTILMLLYLGLSEDFNLRHLVYIDSKEVNFRMHYNRALANHYYQRWDIRTPSEIINKELKPGDLVIANQLEVQQYLKKIDYIFIDYRNPRLWQQSVLGGKKEKWTNANLLYKLSDLENVLSNTNSTIWFIEYRHNAYRTKELEEISFYEKFGKYFYYSSIDKKINVYKIDKRLYSFAIDNSLKINNNK